MMIGTAARAQTAFCPSLAGQPALALSNGACTNVANGRGLGAFSGAALATQALSNLSQSATQETVRNTSAGIASRREQEQQQCPAGYSRVNGTCERTAVPSPAPVVAARPVKPLKRIETVRTAPRPIGQRPARSRLVRRAPRVEPVEAVVAPPPPAPLAPVPFYQNHFGSWAQVFGNYEERSATGTNLIACCNPPIPLALSESSRANTVGFLGGIDYTVRSLQAPGDGLILGLLSGYMSTDIRVTNSTVSRDPRIQNGSGNLKATLSGPSAGVYGLYFIGPFSADLTFKADILDLNEKFSDVLAFGGPSSRNFKSVPFSGAGSGGLTNLSTFGNLYYRLFNVGAVWFEPTVGFQYTDSLFDADAKRALGLDDGYLLMVQGGVRMGTDYVFQNASRVTTTLTGLAYDDVRVRGGFTQGAIFQTGNDLLARSDEGKIRGRGVLAVNYDMGRGLNVFVQGDVYGGENLLGAGGKGGLRVEW